MKFNFLKTMFVAYIFSVSSLANAGFINGAINVDNAHWVYLSTDNNVQGSLLSSGNNWKVTDTFNANLSAGTDYFLHIRAEDYGVIAGLIGNFNIDGGGHLFSNGLTDVLSNTTDWQVSTSGWNNYVSASMVNGNNGSAPWGTRPAIDANSTWIWSSDAYNDTNAYFSLAITAVPEPSTLAIFALGLMGLAVRKSKKQA